MIEVLRFEVRQIFGGRKKWFVALFLCLPIVLTTLARTFGGLEEGAMSSDATGPDADYWFQQGYVEVPIEFGEANLLGGKIVLRDGQVAIGVGAGLLPVRLKGLEIDGGRVIWQGQEVEYLGAFPDGFVYQGGHLFVHRDFDPRHLPQMGVSWSTGHAEPLAFDAVGGILLFVIYPQTLCILLALLYGASLLAAELEAKTITYLFTRPLSRAKILWGKYLAVVLTLSLPTVASLAIAWGILGMPGGPSYLGALSVATVLGLSAYNALFLLVGLLLPTRAMVSCLVYAVLFEYILSFVPALVNMLTITYHLRSIAVNLAGFELPSFLRRIVAGDALPSWGGIACIVLIALALAGEIAKRREYVVTEQV